jgi:hypothetical protein
MRNLIIKLWAWRHDHEYEIYWSSWCLIFSWILLPYRLCARRARSNHSFAVQCFTALLVLLCASWSRCTARWWGEVYPQVRVGGPVTTGKDRDIQMHCSNYPCWRILVVESWDPLVSDFSGFIIRVSDDRPFARSRVGEVSRQYLHPAQPLLLRSSWLLCSQRAAVDNHYVVRRSTTDDRLWRIYWKITSKN